MSETKQPGPTAIGTVLPTGGFPQLPAPPEGAFAAPPTLPRLPTRKKAPRPKAVTHSRLQAEVRDYISRRLEDHRERGGLDPVVPQLYRALAADRRVDIHAEELADKKTRLDAGLPTAIESQAPVDLSKLSPDEIRAMRTMLLKVESENPTS